MSFVCSGRVCGGGARRWREGGGVFKSGFVPKTAQATRICRTAAAKTVSGAWRALQRNNICARSNAAHHVHRSSRCSSSKARARAVSTTAALTVGTERPRRQRRRVSTRHQSIEAARHFKSIPRRATLSALYGGAAAQGARPGPGRVPGRAARGDPRTPLLPRDVDRRIGAVAMRSSYTTLLPTWPQGRHSRIAAVPTPAWYQRRSHRALSSVFSLF